MNYVLCFVSNHTKLLSVIILTILFFNPVNGICQLTDEDITELQKHIENEGLTFTVSASEITKYPLEELCGDVVPPNWRATAVFDPMDGFKSPLPSRFDWRDYCEPTPIKNQGSCGSCWAFGACGTFENIIKIRDDIEYDFSEQWMVSCNTLGGDCDGGWYPFDHFLNLPDACGTVGPVLEESFPYQAADLDCECPYPRIPNRIKSWAYIGSSTAKASVDAIKEAIFNYGPVRVSLFPNNAFHAYESGVFNECSPGFSGHAVILFGWDDSQGENGVWFLRNSWGTNWGEDGYMRIQYECCEIGYVGAYVDYGIASAYLSGDTVYGHAPFTVNFSQNSSPNVMTWDWSFGDGSSSEELNPAHTYQDAGFFDVSLKVTSEDDTLNHLRANYILAYADTLKSADRIVYPGEPVEIIISVKNTIPVQLIRIPVEIGGTFDLTYDSVSTAGCRTEYFQDIQFIHYDGFNKRMTLELESSLDGSAPLLPSGTGDILKLYFTSSPSAVDGQSAFISFNGYNTYLPEFYSESYQYPIDVIDCEVSVSQYVLRGDVNTSGDLDISDLVYFVEYSFNSGPPPVPMDAGDIDCSGSIDISDIVYLVNYMFADGPPPCQ